MVNFLPCPKTIEFEIMSYHLTTQILYLTDIKQNLYLTVTYFK